MDGTQFDILLGAIATAGAAVAAALRWAANRVVKALDDNSTAHKEAAASTVSAYREFAHTNVEHATAMATLAAKIDQVSDWVEDHTPVTDPERPSARRQPTETGPTPRGGYGPYRPPTHNPKEPR